MKDSVFAIALLVGVWCVAIVGIVLKLIWPGRFDRLSVGLYLAMGWSGLMLYDPRRDGAAARWRSGSWLPAERSTVSA